MAVRATGTRTPIQRAAASTTPAAAATRARAVRANAHRSRCSRVEETAARTDNPHHVARTVITETIAMMRADSGANAIADAPIGRGAVAAHHHHARGRGGGTRAPRGSHGGVLSRRATSAMSPGTGSSYLRLDRSASNVAASFPRCRMLTAYASRSASVVSPATGLPHRPASAGRPRRRASSTSARRARGSPLAWTSARSITRPSLGRLSRSSRARRIANSGSGRGIGRAAIAAAAMVIATTSRRTRAAMASVGDGVANAAPQSVRIVAQTRLRRPPIRTKTSTNVPAHPEFLGPRSTNVGEVKSATAAGTGSLRGRCRVARTKLLRSAWPSNQSRICATSRGRHHPGKTMPQRPA